MDLGNASTFVEGARTVGVWVSANPSATRCADFGTAACADTLLDWLPESAFRRPITSDERRELRTLYDALAQEYDHAYATSGVVRAILLSPDFLYRTELGGASEPRAEVELTDHEIATLLAFALTDRAPDAELLAAAEAGRLGRADEREAHARRLMDDSSEVWRRFFWEWLRMATLQSQGNEVGLEPELVAQMEAELRAFVGDVIVEERGTLRDLMSATHTFASPELAALYGASHPGEGVARVELAPERGGLLTRGAWLVAHGKRGRDNVVRRGMGVFVDAMCNDIQVPADLDVEAELDRLVGPDATVREVTEARGNAGVCGNCHRFADPVGLVFENFASDGAWQTSYADGLPVEPQITLEGLGSFDDASSFSAALAEDLRFQHCLVRRFAHFALGVDLGSPAAVAWTNEAHASFVESGTSFEEMVVALVRHPAFIERKAD